MGSFTQSGNLLDDAVHFYRADIAGCTEGVSLSCKQAGDVRKRNHVAMISGSLDFSKPPLHRRVEMSLLYDGFFSFAVVRQIYIDYRIIMRSYA